MPNLLEALGVRPEELNPRPVDNALQNLREMQNKGGWQNFQPQAQTVSDTTGPFPRNQRFADPVRNYDALFKNIEQGQRIETPRPAPDPTALEKFLRSAYGVAMTPLPPPPQWDVEGFAAKLKSAREAIPDIDPQLPVAPAWIQQYIKERGLRPGP